MELKDIEEFKKMVVQTRPFGIQLRVHSCTRKVQQPWSVLLAQGQTERTNTSAKMRTSRFVALAPGEGDQLFVGPDPGLGFLWTKMIRPEITPMDFGTTKILQRNCTTNTRFKLFML